MNVSVVIPYRESDSYRKNNFAWISRRWQILFPEWEKVSADSNHREFNRSASRNEGIRHVGGDIIVVADADTIPMKESLEEAVELVVAQGRTWCIAYQSYYNLNQHYTDNLIHSSANVGFSKPRKGDCEHYALESWAGMLVLPKKAFDECGGWDERFRAWGGEDNAFQMKMDTLWGQYRRASGFALHMWHPVTEEERFEQPEWPHNQELMDQYKRATGNPVEMRKVVA